MRTLIEQLEATQRVVDSAMTRNKMTQIACGVA